MEFELNGKNLKYIDEENIFIGKENNWRKLGFCNNKNGYKILCINRKNYLVHRVIAYLFLGLNIDNPKEIIDHIDRNPSNNKIENLRIVSYTQNQWNKGAKGYGFRKDRNKWRAKIKSDGKHIFLGYYETEEEARNAYLDAKKIYHVIE
jgi:hypothetical protein